MKLSMMSYTMARQPNFDVKRMFELTVELGFAGVDMVTCYDIPAADVRKMADDYGVPIVAHTFFAAIAAFDAKERKEGLEKCKRSLEDAVTLGAPVVMIPTPPTAGVDRDAARRNWIEGLKLVVPMAAEAGVILTVENFPGKESPFVIADDVLEAIEAVPGLKLTYDNGNAASGEEPAQSFARCAEHVVHAHFKDWTVKDEPAEGYREMLDGKYYRPALVGEGVVDHAAVLAAMKAAGYDGCINIEYENDDYVAGDGIRKAADYLRATWAGLD